MQFLFEEVSSNQDITKILEKMASCQDTERGEIFTKKPSVDFILDMAGYTDSKILMTKSILEPSFGGGDFLIPIVHRLLKSYFRKEKNSKGIVKKLKDSIRAVELFTPSYNDTKLELHVVICSYGVSSKDAKDLLSSWLINSDFLLTDFDDTYFDFVIGNPPYVRQDEINNSLLSIYRSKYSTIYDRADLYVPFIQRSLELLKEKGKLGFICSDRWMKNKYGGPLRKLVSSNYNLSFFVDMFSIDAFKTDVSAYPSIFLIENEKTQNGKTKILNNTSVDTNSFNFKKLLSEELFTEVENVMDGKEPWLLNNPHELLILRNIEAKFPRIEDVDCKIGIGVATGNDSVYIKTVELDIEKSQKLPLAMASEIKTGKIESKGTILVNPWTKKGKLVNLEDFPKLKKYYEDNEELIRKRYVAKKSPDSWYKTIDKVNHDLISKEKLLIPDIKGKSNIVYDEGKFYPHHNLYFIVSNGDWEVRAIEGIMKSEVTQFFISKYSLRMRGGYLRYQAQFLRRIRIPNREETSDSLVKNLIKAVISSDDDAINNIVCEIYGLNMKNRKLIAESLKELT